MDATRVGERVENSLDWFQPQVSVSASNEAKRLPIEVEKRAGLSSRYGGCVRNRQSQKIVVVGYRVARYSFDK
jgi:hypothetical protein